MLMPTSREQQIYVPEEIMTKLSELADAELNGEQVAYWAICRFASRHTPELNDDYQRALMREGQRETNIGVSFHYVVRDVVIPWMLEQRGYTHGYQGMQRV